MKIFQIITFLAFTISVAARYGILPSISDSWYMMKHRWLFSLFIFCLAVPMLLYNSPWFFGCGSVLMFVGFAPAFREDVTEKAHVFGAVGSIALGFGGLLAQGIYWPLLAFVLVSAGIYGFKISNKTWWVEVSAFTAIMIGML